MSRARASYESLCRELSWNILHHYIIGVDICDKWADGPAEKKLIYERNDGRVCSYSFDDLCRLSNRSANLFAAHGVRYGDRVAIMLPQQPETAYAHLAAYKMGTVAVPLFTLLGFGALRHRLADSSTKLFLTDAVPQTATGKIIRRALHEIDACTEFPADVVRV